MKDLLEKLEKFRVDAEDCALISKLATDPKKRDTFARLSAQLQMMADDVEAMITAKQVTEANERELCPPSRSSTFE
jgi:hypothetical protein